MTSCHNIEKAIRKVNPKGKYIAKMKLQNATVPTKDTLSSFSMRIPPVQTC